MVVLPCNSQDTPPSWLPPVTSWELTDKGREARGNCGQCSFSLTGTVPPIPTDVWAKIISAPVLVHQEKGHSLVLNMSTKEVQMNGTESLGRREMAADPADTQLFQLVMGWHTCLRVPTHHTVEGVYSPVHDIGIDGRILQSASRGGREKPLR